MKHISYPTNTPLYNGKLGNDQEMPRPKRNSQPTNREAGKSKTTPRRLYQENISQAELAATPTGGHPDEPPSYEYEKLADGEFTSK